MIYGLDADDLRLEPRMMFVHVLDQLELRLGRTDDEDLSCAFERRTTSPSKC